MFLILVCWHDLDLFVDFVKTFFFPISFLFEIFVLFFVFLSYIYLFLLFLFILHVHPVHIS